MHCGRNRPEFIEAVVRYLRDGGVITSLDLRTSVKEWFLESFQDVILVPRELDFVVQFTGPTGANAVEAALKVASRQWLSQLHTLRDRHKALLIIDAIQTGCGGTGAFFQL